jgi:hypothetical protein
MKFFDNITDWLEGVYSSFGKFVSEHWFMYWVVLAIIAAGGVIGDLFGWPFSLFVPGWFVLVGWVMKKKYDKSQ